MTEYVPGIGRTIVIASLDRVLGAEIYKAWLSGASLQYCADRFCPPDNQTAAEAKRLLRLHVKHLETELPTTEINDQT